MGRIMYIFELKDFTNSVTPRALADHARKMLGIKHSLDELTVPETSLVLQWIGWRSKGARRIMGDIVPLGPRVMGLMMFVRAIVFPEFYAQLIVWARN